MSEPTSGSRNLRPEAEVPVRAGIPWGQLWLLGRVPGGGCAQDDMWLRVSISATVQYQRLSLFSVFSLLHVLHVVSAVTHHLQELPRQKMLPGWRYKSPFLMFLGPPSSKEVASCLKSPLGRQLAGLWEPRNSKS